jgi:mitochondrial cardiolipin hydrolase
MRRSALAPLLGLILTAPALAQGPEAYFSPFDDCEARAMAVLDTAQRTLDIAQYNIRNERFIAKLEQLRARGVQVRIVVCAKQAEKEYNTLDDVIEQKGFDIVRYRNTRADFAIMHLKFTIVDDATVMTGSYNWNETAQEVNDENMVVLRDPALAAAYKAEFEELRGAPEVAGPGRGAGVTVYFSPEDRPRDAVLQQIAAAQRSITVCMFTFKDDRIARAMRDAARRGVKVLLVAEKKQADTTQADEIVASAGPNARVIIAANTSSQFAAMHHKFGVFDEARVITGACNWTSTAFTSSNEDLLVIESEPLARQYLAGAGDVVARYAPQGYDPAAFGIDRPNARVNFVVNCHQTYLGDRVVIVGSDPALGAWDPARGITLNTNESLFPVWSGKVVLPRGARHEWKIVIVSASGEVRWELGANRALQTDPRGTARAVMARYRDGSVGDADVDEGSVPLSVPPVPDTPGIIDGLPGN